MELRDIANTEASAFIERLVAAAEARAQNARAEAEQAVASMRTEVEALRSELEGEATRAAAFEADLDAVIEAHRQVDSERLAAESARAHEAAARARVEEELRGVRELLERARAEALRVSAALEDEAAEKALVQEELEGVRLALAGLEKSYEAAERKIGALDGRLAELTQAESALRAQLSDAAARATTIEAETAAAAQAMRDRYDAEIRDARRAVDTLVIERDAARGDLEMIRTEADMLRGDLAAMQDTADRHRAHAEALEAERDAVRGEARGLESERDALRSDLDAARAQADAARAELETARRDIHTSGLEAESARAEAVAARADAEVLRTNAGALHSDAEAWRAQEEMLRAEIELSRDEAGMLRMEVDRSRTEIEKLRAEAERLRADAEALRVQSASSEELTTLQEMLDASREHHERQVALAKELEAKLHSAEGRLQNVEGAAASMLAASIRAIDSLSGAATISELFGTVVRELATELPRVAIFRVKGSHLEGEHGAGFDETVLIKKIVIPMNLDSVITRAAHGGGLVRVEGDELAATRPPFGGSPVSAIAVPISFQGEPLAVLYADAETPATNAHTTFALLVVRHATVLLSRLTHELKVLKELRDYAVLLLQEAEQMFIADVESGRAAHDSVRRLRDTVDCGRQLFAQRAALEGTEAAGLFDEQVSIVINAQASAFAEALGAATQGHQRAAS